MHWTWMQSPCTALKFLWSTIFAVGKRDSMHRIFCYTPSLASYPEQSAYRKCTSNLIVAIAGLEERVPADCFSCWFCTSQNTAQPLWSLMSIMIRASGEIGKCLRLCYHKFFNRWSGDQALLDISRLNVSIVSKCKICPKDSERSLISKLQDMGSFTKLLLACFFRSNRCTNPGFDYLIQLVSHEGKTRKWYLSNPFTLW